MQLKEYLQNYYQLSSELLDKVDQWFEKINLDKSGWWDFYKQKFKEETDKAKIAAFIKDYLNTNFCKP